MNKPELFYLQDFVHLRDIDRVRVKILDTFNNGFMQWMKFNSDWDIVINELAKTGMFSWLEENFYIRFRNRRIGFRIEQDFWNALQNKVVQTTLNAIQVYTAIGNIEFDKILDQALYFSQNDNLYAENDGNYKISNWQDTNADKLPTNQQHTIEQSTNGNKLMAIKNVMNNLMVMPVDKFWNQLEVLFVNYFETEDWF